MLVIIDEDPLIVQEETPTLIWRYENSERESKQVTTEFNFKDGIKINPLKNLIAMIKRNLK